MSAPIVGAGPVGKLGAQLGGLGRRRHREPAGAAGEPRRRRLDRAVTVAVSLDDRAERRAAIEPAGEPGAVSLHGAEVHDRGGAALSVGPCRSRPGRRAPRSRRWRPPTRRPPPALRPCARPAGARCTAGRSSCERLQSACEQCPDRPGQDVAGPGGRQARARQRVDRQAVAGRLPACRRPSGRRPPRLARLASRARSRAGAPRSPPDSRPSSRPSSPACGVRTVEASRSAISSSRPAWALSPSASIRSGASIRPRQARAPARARRSDAAEARAEDAPPPARSAASRIGSAAAALQGGRPRSRQPTDMTSVSFTSKMCSSSAGTATVAYPAPARIAAADAAMQTAPRSGPREPPTTSTWPEVNLVESVAAPGRQGQHLVADHAAGAAATGACGGIPMSATSSSPGVAPFPARSSDPSFAAWKVTVTSARPRRAPSDLAAARRRPRRRCRRRPRTPPHALIASIAASAGARGAPGEPGAEDRVDHRSGAGEGAGEIIGAELPRIALEPLEVRLGIDRELARRPRQQHLDLVARRRRDGARRRARRRRCSPCRRRPGRARRRPHRAPPRPRRRPLLSMRSSDGIPWSSIAQESAARMPAASYRGSSQFSIRAQTSGASQGRLGTARTTAAAVSSV